LKRLQKVTNGSGKTIWKKAILVDRVRDYCSITGDGQK